MANYTIYNCFSYTCSRVWYKVHLGQFNTVIEYFVKINWNNNTNSVGINYIPRACDAMIKISPSYCFLSICGPVINSLNSYCKTKMPPKYASQLTSHCFCFRCYWFAIQHAIAFNAGAMRRMTCAWLKRQSNKIGIGTDISHLVTLHLYVGRVNLFWV